MTEIISRVRIATQARQDALDAANGHKVSNPYAEDTEAAQVWQIAFTRHCMQQDECEGVA
jgi:hypothetical protein